MGQLTGSGPGNGTNYVMVDNSVGNNDGRLWVNSLLNGVKIHQSGVVIVFEEEDLLEEGNLYQAGSYTRGIGANGSVGYLVSVGSTDNVHMMFDARTDGNAIFEFYENVTVTDSGTSLPLFNRNRHAAHLGSEIDVDIWINPTVTTSGLMIHNAWFIGGSGTADKFVSATVDAAPGGGDWLLEAGSSYWIKIQNQCGRGMNVDYNFIIHPHEH